VPKNHCKWTVLVQLIIENVVTCFLELVNVIFSNWVSQFTTLEVKTSKVAKYSARYGISRTTWRITAERHRYTLW